MSEKTDKYTVNDSIELIPVLSQGVVTAVNETSVTINITGRLGTISVPLRWVFTDKALEPGQTVEFYFSYMKTV
jgi:hypothetical protein